MSYDRTRGSVIIKPAMLVDADALKIGSSPLAVLHDPENGEQYVMGYNHPAVIPGCVGLWTFDEKNTGTLYDRSEQGNNLTGTSIDSSLYKDTIFGVAYDFDGAADYFSIADNASLDNIRTVEVILNADEQTQYQRIVSKTETVNDPDFWLRFGGNPATQLNIYNANAGALWNFYWTLPSNYFIGKWVHIAVTIDSSNGVKFWVDGELKASDPATNPINNNGSFRIGWGDQVARFFDGKIAAVRICSRALKPHEFMHHWYFNILVGGKFNSDGALLFNEQVSAFKARKVFTVQADWDSRGQMRSSNILVNNIRGVSDESFVPMTNDPSKLIVGGLPLVDDKTVGMWILDGSLNEDGKIIDLSAEANHGTLVSLDDTDLMNSRFGRYYDKDGANDYVSIDDVDVLSFGNGSNDSPFSIEVLIQMDDATNFIIISKGVYNTDAEWRLFVGGGDTLKMMLFDESVADCFIGRKYNTALTSYQNKWIYIAATYSGNESSSGIKLYLNGIRVDDADDNLGSYVAMENLTHDIWIGRHDTNYADGQIAFVRISNIARDADWISHMAQCLHKANAQFQDIQVITRVKGDV